jgi:ubiquitin-conjugating enzyme E2 H
MREPTAYEAKVKEYVSRYATKAAADAADDSSSDEDMSSLDSFSDDEAPGMGTLS